MLASLGQWLNDKLSSFLYAMGYFLKVLIAAINFPRRRQVGARVLVLQILFTGVEAITIISLIALAIGAIIIIQGVNLLPQFGQGDLIYTILIAVIVRELGPILTAFIVTARSGTAIATELGGMVVTHQIEAYISVGINPISYLAVPRFLGVTVSMFLLTLYFISVGLFGAFFLTQLIKPIPFSVYFGNLFGAMRFVDIVSSLVKSLVFGILISVVSTYQGFNVRQASTEVPQRVIKAVGQGIVLCIVANAIISLIYYI